MRRYRYRTAALTGPWRETPEEATRDAVRAKQAEPDEKDPTAIRWIVPGRIEEVHGAGAGARVRARNSLGRS